MTTPTLDIGKSFSRIRRESKLTLKAVSEMTGITVATLSRFENGLTSLNMDRVSRIAAALGIDMASVFGGVENTPGQSAAEKEGAGPVTARRSIERAQLRKLHGIPGGRMMHLCSDLKNRLMFPIYIEVTSKSLEEHGDLIRHAGEEYIYVLSGTLELHSEYYEPVTLAANDSIYIDSSMGHALIAVGDEPVRVISIVTSAEIRHLDAFQRSSERQGGPAIEIMRQLGTATTEDEALYKPLPSHLAKRK